MGRLNAFTSFNSPNTTSCRLTRRTGADVLPETWLAVSHTAPS